MENNEIKIKANDVRQAYDNADENGRKTLENLFGKEVFTLSIMDRVRTFKDACRVLGINAKKWLEENEKMDAGVLAYMKLRIVTTALNEGWQPVFDGKQCRYEVWLNIYTKAQWEKLSEAKKRQGVLVGGRALDGADAGFVYAYTHYAPSYTLSGIGSRLCYKNRELALYSGKQFIDIWADYFFR